MIETTAPQKSVETNEAPFPRKLILSGFLVLTFFLLSIAAWAMLAPVEGAVVARGVVSAEGFRKQVQHLEGGIVNAIHVADGDEVIQGQVLVSLSGVEANSSLAQLDMQRLETMALIARIEAELKDKRAIDFPEDLTSRATEQDVAAVLAGQRDTLISQRKLAKDQLAVLQHKIGQARSEIKGLDGKQLAKQKQRQLLVEELNGLEKGYQKKVVPKRMLLQGQQQLAEVDGDISGYLAEIGQLKQSIMEMKLQLSETQASRRTELTDQLREYRAQLYEVNQQLLRAKDVARRKDIVSPIDGTVVDLQIHTRDGVIAPGQGLMDILPDDDELVIDAFVHPNDIDEVHIGMQADVRLTSLSRRSSRPLQGKITHVSADRIVDPVTAQQYYRARVKLNRSEAKSNMQLTAGMGADVYIRTGARSPYEYLIAPIAKSVQRSMRES
ncbi:MAG: HlyD family type I secretion periplasmic adaptor subunit [Gammaproteobacteria bacterium]|nr:HlyD family type I secretion periplasmic adaptor subunit [Gammaproteobacteria bacterium]MBT8151162.1 HlyD family type I secretion periplasmic adaptor subunit [Gammaproteobacteria bacterium]NNL11523.1 HlyD family type I secretion periplasmic adaptor subunit [Pseudomonadales bacterium]NNM11265.1 HlyD family type I secretion periplasmic adaptor subunit [Pseudomonadales bacterium]RZV56101.1 MAG: HlyD family type I secretion periplasmic adaptor subunit [Pseudomonadales bacterium]